MPFKVNNYLLVDIDDEFSRAFAQHYFANAENSTLVVLAQTAAIWLNSCLINSLKIIATAILVMKLVSQNSPAIYMSTTIFKVY